MKQLPPNTHLEGQVNVWYDVHASLRTLGLLPSQLMPCLVCSEKETPKFQDPPNRRSLGWVSAVFALKAICQSETEGKGQAEGPIFGFLDLLLGS